jgi:hypothetical protein
MGAAPADVLQVLPHEGELLLGWSANPLKLSGAPPPLRLLRLAHRLLQNVTVPAVLPSPMTNDPPLAVAYSKTRIEIVPLLA